MVVWPDKWGHVFYSLNGKVTPPRCSDRPSFMQFGIVHLHILLLSSVGALLPPEKGKTEHFDSNCITPVSAIV